MNAEHWANQHERGHRLFLRLTALMVRYLPTVMMRACTAVVCSYFYLTASAPRRHVRQYQQRLQQQFPHAPMPKFAPVYRQFVAFGEAIADRFAVWQHKITYADLVLDDADNVYADIRDRSARGQILICSHLGNVEVCRALVSHHIGFKMNVLVHSQHAQAFNQALKEAGASDINLIQVSELDAVKMLELAQRLDAGEWLAIASDRVPIHSEKTVQVQFLGATARLPQGAWLMAQLLKAKTNTVFVLKKQGRYHLILRRFADVPSVKRSERMAEMNTLAQRYADQLAQHASEVPLQWFNFYDFWAGENQP